MDNLPLPDVGDTIVRIAGLSPAAQVAAVVVLGCCVCMLIWTRRPPQPPGMETLQLVINAMNEQTQATNAMSDRMERVIEGMERVIEQNAIIIARMPVQTMEKA